MPKTSYIQKYNGVMFTKSLYLREIFRKKYFLAFIVAILFLFIRSSLRKKCCRCFDVTTGLHIEYFVERQKVYKSMQKDFDLKGPIFLGLGNTSQSLKLSDLFTVDNGKVEPVLKEAVPPVRATVLHVKPEVAKPISEKVKRITSRYFGDGGVWLQDSARWHMSLFHASHHISPVPATQDEIEAESSAVQKVAAASCPLHIALDRVLLTSTGVLLACWQVHLASRLTEQTQGSLETN